MSQEPDGLVTEEEEAERLSRSDGVLIVCNRPELQTFAEMFD